MNEGCPRLPSFLAFALKSRHCGLTKPCIQVRHAQGLHNVEGEKNYKAYLNPEYLDAPLTQLGWQQVKNLTITFQYERKLIQFRLLS